MDFPREAATVALPPHIFREYDVRGIAERDLSPPFAYLLGRAFADEFRADLGAGRVSLGRDCRLTGDSYASALREGLLDGGLSVTELGVCPSPLTYFSIFHLELDGGIMVTGSHNPADYNGFKVCVGRSTIHGEQIQTLRRRMEALQAGAPATLAPRKRGERGGYSIIPAYLDHLKKIARPVRAGMRIVLDAGNGTAATVAPPLFEKLGADVVPLFCELDGRFPNHHPDPTVPENLAQLVAKVRETGAELGIAFDGDSDRIGAVDHTGRILFGDELMVVFARDVLKERPGATIISEVKSSHRLYQDIEAKGGRGIMWKTGHSLIKSKMKETGALLAGEMSGHIFFADRYFGYDDAIYAAMRLYEIVSSAGRPLAELIADLPPAFTTPEIRVECVEEKKFALVKAARDELAKAGLKLNEIDGVRAEYADGWGLVRASNTQPVLVLRFEATTPERLAAIRAQFEGALRVAATRIGHPPVDFEAGAH